MPDKNRKDQKCPALQVNGRTLSNETITEGASNNVLGNVVEAWSSPPGSPTGASSAGSPTDYNSVEQVKNVNRQLVIHIEVLRYRATINTRQQEVVITELVKSKDEEVHKRKCEIENLERVRQEKDNELKKLTEENQNKNREVIQYNLYVADLEKEVKASQILAQDLQVQLEDLKKEPLKRAQEQSDLDKLILEMRAEMEEMKKNFADLEKELARANEKIAQQGDRLLLMEVERGNAEIMFKKNMEKATRSMKNEIGKLREVLTRQWEEMKKIREDNEIIKQYLQTISHAAKVPQVFLKNDNKNNEKQKNRNK